MNKSIRVRVKFNGVEKWYSIESIDGTTVGQYQIFRQVVKEHNLENNVIDKMICFFLGTQAAYSWEARENDRVEVKIDKAKENG